MSKIEGQSWVLNKYGLKVPNMNISQKVERLESDNLATFRLKLTGLEGKFSDAYFKQIFSLIPEKLRPAERKTFQAYDGINNIFNLAYEALSWRVHRALINAKRARIMETLLEC